ncbi:hypothetical protein D3C80_2122870 [compost metagenome]
MIVIPAHQRPKARSYVISSFLFIRQLVVMCLNQLIQAVDQTVDHVDGGLSIGEGNRRARAFDLVANVQNIFAN